VSDKQYWGSRLGVVLAVAGSAVGLGNFLRFPGQAAANGAGAFLIPYFIALLIVGIPLAWAEWSMGRHAGVRGFHSAPGIFAALCRNRAAAFLGVFALLIPLMVYTYYVVIEAWCLGYAFNYLASDVLQQGPNPKAYGDFFESFTGQGKDGDALRLSTQSALGFVIFTFILNFGLIMMGLNKGIEVVCKIAMPLMVVCAVCVLIRVLTLGSPEVDSENMVAIYRNSVAADKKNEHPQRRAWLANALIEDGKPAEAALVAQQGLDMIVTLQAKTPTADYANLTGQLNKLKAGETVLDVNQSVAGGLNFMWNPDFEALKKPSTWLAAAGQIFFSLSVGFGVIINYSSYMRRKDDIALSGLTASTTNEFFEVCLAGLITLPAAFIFLGLTAGTFTTFSLGFNALPNVFAMMPGGKFFGFLWFFMLFLAAITSSLSMLQPVSAFLQEGLGVSRFVAALILSVISGLGCAFVMYHTAGLNALDTIDFWCGTFLIVVLALVQAIIYGWIFGIKKGQEELDRGALIRVPRFVSLLLKFVTPVFLIAILVGTILNGSDYFDALQDDVVAQRTVMVIIGTIALLAIMVAIALVRWTKQGKFDDFHKAK